MLFWDVVAFDKPEMEGYEYQHGLFTYNTARCPCTRFQPQAQTTEFVWQAPFQQELWIVGTVTGQFRVLGIWGFRDLGFRV